MDITFKFADEGNAKSTFIESIEKRKIIPFVGAGFTKNISPTMPIWSDTIDIAAELLGYDKEVLNVQGDYLQIAEFLHEERQLNALIEKISKKLENSMFTVQDSDPHNLLPFIDTKSIYTTNWDSWIEKGFERQKVSYKKIIAPEDFIQTAYFKNYLDRIDCDTHKYSNEQLKQIKKENKTTTIVKFHGDFIEPNSIVFRESHFYDRQDFEHPLDIKLRAEMLGASILFIGYSFSDPNVRYIWHKLQKLMRQIDYKFQIKSYFVTTFDNPLLISIYKRKNIETILIDSKNPKEAISNLFEFIIDHQLV